ncbi:restriction endonuclease [Acidipila rosea]|uniref:Restriction endonuclease n=1 Tax=Acidipila rosea TaxID=768535 RepID=A0A4R1KUT2_9BACT|nr:restriction endonuclease [Acidipila rosea]TCK68447.1 restriction endonuclease [Acidipila rosea]
MDVQEAREKLTARHEEDDGPAELPASVLPKLTLNDLPDGATLQVGSQKDGRLHLDWSGTLGRDGEVIYGEADHTWTRKYWYAPLGLEQYLDLVRRAVETRHRVRGDVDITHDDDDGAYVALRFRINTVETNLGKAYEAIRKIAAEVEEAAEHAADEVGQRIAEIAARLSGWGSETLDALVDAVETARSADDKGRTLEELCSRLFSSVPGFVVTGRVRTETEEIDISVVNDSTEPRLRREGALILAECKNWTGKCGKNEFVVFHSKLENRSQRCTLGFLISWNGFTETITKEMLRGSREDILVVPITGEDIRSAVRSDDFTRTLLECWEKAVNL